jgi:hypothetical protein
MSIFARERDREREKEKKIEINRDSEGYIEREAHLIHAWLSFVVNASGILRGNRCACIAETYWDHTRAMQKLAHL